jgi:hypothetical protein
MVKKKDILKGDKEDARTFILLNLPKHPFNLILRQTALTVGDYDAIGFASGLVGGQNIENTVGVDVEGDLDLRNSTR